MTIRPSLDEVWAFLRANNISGHGHNVFLYEPDAVWFGVEVFAPIPQDKRIVITETPAGRAAMVTHVGPYDGIRGTTDGLIAWCRAKGQALGGRSWEVYGDWAENPADLRTDISFLLA